MIRYFNNLFSLFEFLLALNFDYINEVNVSSVQNKFRVEVIT